MQYLKKYKFMNVGLGKSRAITLKIEGGYEYVGSRVKFARIIQRIKVCIIKNYMTGMDINYK